MPTATINGVRLYHELSGRGEIPIVLVHGSWVSHQTWELVVPRLSESFRVLTYDRRGHSQSERPATQGSVREDVADLAALIEHLKLAPAWVAGNSFGASITLRLAGERADLIRGLIGHEPPLFSLLDNDPASAPMLAEVGREFDSVGKLISSGDHRGAAERFVESVALGPGMWAQLPPEFQQTIIENAPTFLDELKDPEDVLFHLDWIKGLSRPALLTLGDQNPPFFAPVAVMLASVLPMADMVTFPGAGHIPHATHPEDYAEAVISFIRKHA